MGTNRPTSAHTNTFLDVAGSRLEATHLRLASGAGCLYHSP